MTIGLTYIPEIDDHKNLRLELARLITDHDGRCDFSEDECVPTIAMPWDTSMLANVYGHVLREDEHDQSLWVGLDYTGYTDGQVVDKIDCGSTGCVAGWAVHESPLTVMKVAKTDWMQGHIAYIVVNGHELAWEAGGMVALTGDPTIMRDPLAAEYANWLFSGSNSRQLIRTWFTWELGKRLGAPMVAQLREAALAQQVPVMSGSTITGDSPGNAREIAEWLIAERVYSLKQDVTRVALHYAREHDWCDVVDQALAEAGVDVPDLAQEPRLRRVSVF
jgi:hypothetical protein